MTNSTAKKTYQIIPAQAGYSTVVKFDDTRIVAVDLPVIAWRIETGPSTLTDKYVSYVFPVTILGDAADMECFVGILQPDGTIIDLVGKTYRGICDCQYTLYPQETI